MATVDDVIDYFRALTLEERRYLFHESYALPQLNGTNTYGDRYAISVVSWILDLEAAAAYWDIRGNDDFAAQRTAEMEVLKARGFAIAATDSFTYPRPPLDAVFGPHPPGTRVGWDGSDGRDAGLARMAALLAEM